MKNCWLDGKTFIITGATSGLGKGLAEKLIRNHGCTVIGIGRSESKFNAFKEDLGELSQLLIPTPFDVTDNEAWLRLADKLEAEGIYPDGLINCAGALPRFRKALNTPIEDTEWILKVDYLACVNAINALYPTLSRKNYPAIINVSSAAALATITGTSIYSAAKSALKSYTEALTYELKGKAYVSLVMPGFARTEIFRDQNTAIEDNKLFMMMSMPADKMINKIYRGIKKRRTRMVLGVDAKAMSFFYRLCPKTTMYLISKILKKADVKLFEEVFTD